MDGPFATGSIAEYHALGPKIKGVMTRRGNPNWGKPDPLRPALVVTFLVVFLIQNTQNRDARAKLDEIIKSIEQAAERNDRHRKSLR
jgi:hypothetical protein